MTDTSKKACYLIRKSGAWYRPNSQGYTQSTILAGRYTFDEANSITHPNGPDGPRDGMSFTLEAHIMDEDWLLYKALAAERDALQATVKYIQDALIGLMEAHGNAYGSIPEMDAAISKAESGAHAALAKAEGKQ